MARSIDQQKEINTFRLHRAGFNSKEIQDAISTQRTLPDGSTKEVPILDLSVPFIRRMIRTRARAAQRHKQQGWTRQQHEDWVDRIYKAKGLDKLDSPFWGLVRIYEDEFSRDNPEYAKAAKVKKHLNRGDIKSQKKKYEDKLAVRRELNKAEIRRIESNWQTLIDRAQTPTEKQRLMAERDATIARLRR